MAVYVATNTMVLVGTAWTGTAPGTGSTPSGTITSTTDISSGTVQLNFNQDFAAANVDALFGLGGTLGLVVGQVTPYYIDIKPTSSARGATNPSFVAGFLNTGINSINGNVGDLAKVQASFPLTGRFIKLTS